MAGAYLSGASLPVSVGIGTLASHLTRAAGQKTACIDVIEIELSMNATDMLALEEQNMALAAELQTLEDEKTALAARVADLEATLEGMVTMEQATQMQIDVMVENFARNGAYQK
mmetsp:Transcript_17725/g.33621  ORF Transcript_17725/g.33621 Transcript_17725/m.33621 type:complete len:114 (-) Transcript_17725:2521-2862(-)